MEWWQIALILLGSIVIGTVVGFLLSYLILRLLQKRKAASDLAQQLNRMLPGWGNGVWDRVFAAIILIIILGTLGALGYVISTPKVGEKFTEFYILGQEGKAANYPLELEVGEEGKVIVGLINHENEKIRYRIEVIIGGNRCNEVGPIVLANEQKWEADIAFVPVMPGENEKVEFLLYKDGEIETYLESLYLWVDVVE